MSVRFRTRASARDKLSSLVEAISASEKRQNEIRDYQNIEANNAIVRLDNAIDLSTNTTTLDSLTKMIDQNTSDLSSPANKIYLKATQDEAANRRLQMKDYEKAVNNMQNKYLGQGAPSEFPGVVGKGIKNLDESDFETWTYDHISRELQEINDFESVFFSDFEKQNAVNFDYNPSLISTGELRRRIFGEGGYKNKLLAGIEAMRGDKKITDNEMIYILSGDSEGLVQARIDNATFYNNRIKSTRTAIGKVKGQISSVFKTIKTEGGFANTFDNKVIIDMSDELYSMWESQYELTDKSEEWQDFYEKKLYNLKITSPEEAVKFWIYELRGLTASLKDNEKEFFKWKGSPVEQYSPELGDTVQDKFKSEFGVTKAKIIPVTPKEQKDLPSDIMLDFKSGYYYSPKENAYYDNDAVERILEL